MMKVFKLFIKVLQDSVYIVFKKPILWLFFYFFVILDLVIIRFVPDGISRILLILLNLLIIGLPGLKVEFLSLADKQNKLPFKDLPRSLFYYFKKLLVLNIFLLILGGLFTVIANLVNIGLGSPAGILFGYQLAELIRLIVFLPLAIIYFSLFHLYVVILVKKKAGVTEAFKLSIDYIKDNKELIIMVVLLSLIVHYPVSEVIMSGLRYLGNSLDPIIIKALVSFVNVIIDLYFFAIWMVLYNKKS